MLYRIDRSNCRCGVAAWTTPGPETESDALRAQRLARRFGATQHRSCEAAAEGVYRCQPQSIDVRARREIERVDHTCFGCKAIDGAVGCVEIVRQGFGSGHFT